MSALHPGAGVTQGLSKERPYYKESNRVSDALITVYEKPT